MIFFSGIDRGFAGMKFSLYIIIIIIIIIYDAVLCLSPPTFLLEWIGSPDITLNIFLFANYWQHFRGQISYLLDLSNISDYQYYIY